MIDLFTLELTITSLHCMFSEIKNSLYEYYQLLQNKMSKVFCILQLLGKGKGAMWRSELRCLRLRLNSRNDRRKKLQVIRNVFRQNVHRIKNMLISHQQSFVFMC
jgi:hypothetical protein